MEDAVDGDQATRVTARVRFSRTRWDSVDPVADELLAKFVVGSHRRSHPYFDSETEELDVGTSLDEDVCHIIWIYTIFLLTVTLGHIARSASQIYHVCPRKDSTKAF